MTTKPENPSAFPAIYAPPGFHVTEGMTLRDYFAAAALPAIIDANCAGTHTSWMRSGEKDKTLAMARDAYSFADAMLKVREATND